MRETGPVRLILGEGAEASDNLISFARTQLGIMKNLMRLGGLQQSARTLLLPDGTIIRTRSIMGQDSIQIIPPVVVAEEVEEASVPSIAAVVNWMAAGFWADESFTSIPSVWTAAGRTALPLGVAGYGEAMRIIPGGEFVIGRLDGTQACWWAQEDDASWTLHTTAYTWSDLVYWDFNANAIGFATPPALTLTVNEDSSYIRIVYQQAREYRNPVTLEVRSILGYLAVEMTDGSGDVFTYGSEPNGLFLFPPIIGRSLDDWVTIAVASIPDLTGYVANDGLGDPYVAATIYGPYRISRNDVYSSVNFAVGGTLWNGADAYNAGYPMGFWDVVMSRAHLGAVNDLEILGPYPTSLTFDAVSLDGQWWLGEHGRSWGYDDFLGLSSTKYTDLVRYKSSIEVMRSNLFTDAPGGAEATLISDTGAACGTESATGTTTPTRTLRWGASEEVVQGYDSAPERISPDGTAVCGNLDDGRAWSWAGGTLSYPEVPTECTYSGAHAVSDGGRVLAGFVGSNDDEWQTVWVDGKLVFRQNGLMQINDCVSIE